MFATPQQASPGGSRATACPRGSQAGRCPGQRCPSGSSRRTCLLDLAISNSERTSLPANCLPAASPSAAVSSRGGPERGEAFPVRQPTMRPPRRTEGGRHRRAVPASLPQSAPALILAVPGRDVDLSSGAGRRAHHHSPGGQPGRGRARRADRRRRLRRPVRPARGARRRGRAAVRQQRPVRRGDPADRHRQPAGDPQAARGRGGQRHQRHRQRLRQLQRDDRRGAAHQARRGRARRARTGSGCSAS